MAEDQKVKIKDVGGVSAGSSGATLWHAEAAGEKWTFRNGRGSRIMDVHWFKPGRGKKTLWVARTREFLRWAVRTVRDDVALAAIDAASAPVSRA